MSSPKESPLDIDVFVYSFTLQTVLFWTLLSLLGYDAIQSQPDAAGQAPPTTGVSRNVTKRGLRDFPAVASPASA